jgi:hypothetical protein
MSEEQQAAAKKKEAPVGQKRMSKVINETLGLEIDWTALCDRDLRTMHNIVTNDRKIRRLALRILRHRIHGLGHQAKREAKGFIRDLIQESGIGDKALKLLAGDDDEVEDDGLDGGE